MTERGGPITPRSVWQDDRQTLEDRTEAMYAVDIHTGQRLNDEQATKASDNPDIWTWVTWIQDGE